MKKVPFPLSPSVKSSVHLPLGPRVIQLVADLFLSLLLFAVLILSPDARPPFSLPLATSSFLRVSVSSLRAGGETRPFSLSLSLSLATATIAGFSYIFVRPRGVPARRDGGAGGKRGAFSATESHSRDVTF